MIEQLIAIETNEILVNFTLNNLVLFMLIKYCLAYVCKKTPWAADDDLSSFFGGAIDLIINRKKEGELEDVYYYPQYDNYYSKLLNEDVLYKYFEK